MVANGISRQILMFSATALFASGPAFACSGPACPCESLEQALTAISAIEAMAVDGPADNSRLKTLGDQEFMREALEDSAAKVLLGQLALQKSRSDDLRQFGQKLIQDQTELSQQVLQRVGKPLGVQEQKDLSKKDRQQAARLVALSGAQFDDEYIKFMLKDQKQDLKRFDGETQLALDPGVKIAAEYGKKLISKHLESIERIAEGRSLVADNQKATIGGK